MRLSRALGVMSCALAIAACDGGGGDGSGNTDGGGGFLGHSNAGTSGVFGGAGSSGSTGSGNVSTGLPSSKPLGQITQAEAQSLCNSLASSARNVLSPEQLHRFTCTLSALPASIRQGASGMEEIDRATCEQLVNECLMEEPDDTTNDNDCENTQLSTSAAGCQATVGELEACLNASIAQLRDLLERFDCNATVTELMAGGGFEEPAACATLDMKCPGVLDDVGADTDVLPGDMGEDSDFAGAGGMAGAAGTGGAGE